jgi:colanic acid biosynthesis protein WcaH
MFLDGNTFFTIIKNTPLISVDLIVYNDNDQILLGKRLNRPAKGYWFVPGGRIQKSERLEDAFKRLTLDELGTEFSITQAELVGPFTHLYDDCVFGEEFGTHYVAIAYRLVVNSQELSLPIDKQHDAYKWLEVKSLLNDESVHIHTKWYFE